MLAVTGSSPNSTCEEAAARAHITGLAAQFAVIALAKTASGPTAAALLRGDAFGGHSGHRLVRRIDRPWLGSFDADKFAPACQLVLTVLAASRRTSASALAFARIASFLASRAFSAASSLAFAFSFSASFLAAAFSASVTSFCLAGFFLALSALATFFFSFAGFSAFAVRLCRLGSGVLRLCRGGKGWRGHAQGGA